MKVIQDVLGHSDIGTTMNIYADATNELKEKEFISLSEYLSRETIKGEKKSQERLVIPVRNVNK